MKELQGIRSPGKHPRAVEEGHRGEETTKAVARAVFQRHGEGGVGHGRTHGMAPRRPTRFKMEAQMKQEVAHWCVDEAVAIKWDAGSTLFDSFELNSLLKALEEATHAPSERHSHWGSGEAEDCRLDTVDGICPSETHGQGHRQPAMRYNLTGNVEQGHGDAKDDASSVFGHWYPPKSIRRRSFDSSNYEKPAQGASHHHHNRWKSLLHTLHLDGANGLFHGFHKSHTQVVPHDLEKPQEQKGGSHHRDHGSHGDAHLGRELYDGHFKRNDLHVSKDVNPPSEKEDGHHHHRHHPHFWKVGLALTQPFCRPGHLLIDDERPDSESHKGHNKYHGHRHADLRAAWSSITANLLHHHHHHDHKREHGRRRDDDEESVIEHHHHHHHHHAGEDNKMIMQAISMRVGRASFDERARRLSFEEGGLKAPRNSLETSVWA